METIERRTVTVAGLSLEERSAKSPVFRGHAAVFDQETDLGWFRETVAPGAFAKTIKEADVRFLFNHNPDSVMARSKAGTLRLSEDGTGLATEADLNPDDTDAQRLIPKLRSGNVDQMSFAFRVVKEEWDETDPNHPLRTLREVQLYDVSPVTFPAYEGTDAQLRAALDSFRRARGGPELTFDALMERLSSLTAEEATRASSVLRSLIEPEPEPVPDHSEDHSFDLERARMALAIRRRRLFIPA